MFILQGNSSKMRCDLCMSVSSRKVFFSNQRIAHKPRIRTTQRGKKKKQMQKWPKLDLYNFGLCFSSHCWLSFGSKNLHVKGQVFHLLRSMVGCPLPSANSESCHRFDNGANVGLLSQTAGNRKYLGQSITPPPKKKKKEKQMRKNEVSWEIVALYRRAEMK